MKRRRFLQAGGAVFVLLAGCLGDASPSSDTPAQSGSGHPCEHPRTIDYDAIDQYRDNGVYLENSDDVVHTACVTVTKDQRTSEEDESASPPPLHHMGYAVDPDRGVELFTFTEPGHYTFEVSIEETTATETFETTEADFADDNTTITTFEITSASTIQITQSGES